MRLRSLVIDGADDFGRIDSGELPNGLVVIFSPDKDRIGTALSMMRRLLFSANGTGYGSAVGTAHLSGENGDFELSTNGSPESETFRRWGGGPANHRDLGELFGGSERGQLRAIFDVTSNDLPRDIFARGPLQSNPIDAPSLAPLRQRMHELLGEEGGQIGDLLDQLAAAEADLEAALQRELTYFEHRDRERAATAEVGGLCADLADLRRRRERLEIYGALWPSWVKRLAVERELGQLEPIDDFPDSDLSIVEAQQQSRDAETALRKLRNQLRQVRAELESLPGATDRHQFIDRVDPICSELPDYRRRLMLFARARARRGEINSLVPQLSDRPAPANPDGDSTVDPTDFDLESAREWLVRSDTLTHREAAARAELARTRASLKQLRNERQRAVRAAKTLRGELDDSDEYWRALWTLRDDLEELWEVQSQGEAAARAAEQRLESLENLDRRQYRIPDPKLRAALWIVAGACFVATLWMTKQERALSTLFFGGACLVAITVDFALGWRARWAEIRNTSLRTSEVNLRHSLERARQRRDSRWRSADEVTHRIEGAARALSLPATPSIEDVDAAEERLFVASRKLPQRGPLAQTALAIHDQRDDEERLMSQLRELREVREASALEWEEWKHAAGLPDQLDQSELTTFLCEYDRLRELREESLRVDTELRDLAPSIESWEDKARALLTAAGASIDANLCGRNLEHQLAQLRDSAHRSARLAERRDQLNERIEELAEREAEMATTAHRYTDLFEALRKQAGTSDEAEFERRREVFHKRRALGETLQKRETAFTAMLAEHKLADDEELRGDLTSGSADSWSEEGCAVEAEIERLEAAMEAATRERTAAASSCSQLEHCNDAGRAQQLCAGLRREIGERAAEWRTLALATGLVEEASKTLSDRTVLFDHASSTLKALTRGELVRVTTPDAEGTIRIVDRAGKQYTMDDDLPERWMRQLALSLRLGLVREASVGASVGASGDGAVPVLVDDVLCDVDGEHAGATAREIHRLAREQQVFYFTSREASVEALRGAGEVSRLLQV